MKKIVCKIAKYVAIAAGSIIALAVVICSLAVWLLTPAKLTPLVERYASQYLLADVSATRVELTFWHTFPKFSVDVDSLSVISRQFNHLPDSVQRTLPSGADSLLTIAHLDGGINLPYLMAGKIALYNVAVDGLKANIVELSPTEANYLVVPGMEEQPDDTTEPHTEFPDISLHRFTLSNCGPIRYFSVPDSIDVALTLADASLSSSTPKTYKINLSGDVATPLLHEFDFTRLTFGTDGTIEWHSKSPLEVKIENTTLTVDEISAKVTADVDFSKSLTLRQLSADLHPLKLSSLLPHLPPEYRQAATPLKTDLTIEAAMHITEPWVPADTTRYPSLEASLNIAPCDIEYQNLKISDFQAQLMADIDGANLDASKITLKRFTARGRMIDVDITATATNIVTDAYVDGTFKGHMNLGAMPPKLRRLVPATLAGRLRADTHFRLNLSDLTPERFHNIYATGEVQLTGFSAESTAEDEPFATRLNNALFRFGSNSSFVKDDVKVDSLLAISLKIDTLSASAMGVSVQLKEFAAGGGSVNRASSADTTIINPFGGRISFERFSLDSPADTLRMRMRNGSAGALLRRFKGNKKVPQLTMNLTLDGLQFGQPLAKMALRKANVDFTMNMRQRRQAKRDSIARKTLPADSTASRRRLNATAPDSMHTDRSPQLELLRRWDFSGRVQAESGRLLTPLFPLRNSLSNLDLKFSQDSILLTNLLYRAGQSDFRINGVVSNLRRSLTGRRRGELGVKLSMRSDTINVNEIVKAMFAGSAITEQADSTLVWSDSDTDDATGDNFAQTADTTTVNGPLVLPRNIDATFVMRANNVLYSDLQLQNFRGDLMLYDGDLSLRNLSASAEVGSIDLSGLYSTSQPDSLRFAMGMRVSDFRLDRLTSIIPSIDSLMPVMQNFAGTVNADIAVATNVTEQMDIDISTLQAAINIEGDSLVLIDADTFKSLGKWLMFRNKQRNVIDRMAVEMVIDNANIELYPFMFDIDRYRLGVMGHNDLAMNLNYHVSVLKSPLPFKFGINIKGTPDDMKISLGGAKFKENMVGERHAIASDTRVNIAEQIENMFRRGVEKARHGADNFKSATRALSSSAPQVTAPAELLRKSTSGAMNLTDSLQMIQQGLIAMPDSTRFSIGHRTLQKH